MEWKKIGEEIDIVDRVNRVADEGTLMPPPVALSHDGNRAFVGTPRVDSHQGHTENTSPVTVKIYDFGGGKWNEMGSFSGWNRDGFGESISLSGDGKRLAIGAFRSYKNSYRTGHVETYEHIEGNHWKSMGKGLKGLKSLNNFGNSIAMSKDGSRICVGANGGVRVFYYVRDVWKRIVQSIVGEADWGELILDFIGNPWKQMGQTIIGKFGKTYSGDIVSLSSDGNVVAIGAPNCGYVRVRVFKYSTEDEGEWVRVGHKFVGGGLSDYFGRSISINGKGNAIAITGGTWVNESVKVFRFGDNKWDTMGQTFFGENCVYSVYFAPNANRIAVYHDDGSVGYVKIFDHDGHSWVQIGSLAASLFEKCRGSSVCLSAYGDRLAVASMNGNGTNNIGHLSIYEYGQSV